MILPAERPAAHRGRREDGTFSSCAWSAVTTASEATAEPPRGGRSRRRNHVGSDRRCRASGRDWARQQGWREKREATADCRGPDDGGRRPSTSLGWPRLCASTSPCSRSGRPAVPGRRHIRRTSSSTRSCRSCRRCRPRLKSHHLRQYSWLTDDNALNLGRAGSGVPLSGDSAGRRPPAGLPGRPAGGHCLELVAGASNSTPLPLPPVGSRRPLCDRFRTEEAGDGLFDTRIRTLVHGSPLDARPRRPGAG